MRFLKCLMLILYSYFQVGCTQAETSLESLSLSSSELVIRQGIATTEKVKVLASTHSTVFQISCIPALTTLLLSYDTTTWNEIGDLTCVNGFATINYSVPAPIMINTTAVDFPVIAFWIKAKGKDNGSAIETAVKKGLFVQPNFDATTLAAAINNQSAVTNMTVVSANVFAEQKAADLTFSPYEVYATPVAGCTAGGAWLSYAPLIQGLTLPVPNNTNYLYFKFRDEVGNESACINDSILHDNIPPTAVSFLINNGDPQTISTSATLSISASNSPIMMKLSNAADCSGTSMWETYATTKPWTILGPGVNVVSVIFKDVAGNESSCLSDEIVYDNDPPVVPTLLTLAAGTLSTDNKNPVSVVVSPVIEGDTALVYSDSTCTTLLGSAAAGPGGKATVTATLSGPGARVIYAKVRDITNLNSNCSSALVNYTLDQTNPVVTAITSAVADGNYVTGAVIPIQVTFSKIINVVGNPKLTLILDTTPVDILYSSGTGTTTLTFIYTVANSHVSARLDLQATTSLALNGGSIKDAANNAAILTVPVTGTTGSLYSNKQIRINADVSVLSVVGPPKKNYFAGAPLDFIVNWSGPVVVTGSPQLQIMISSTPCNAVYSIQRSTASESVFRCTVPTSLIDLDGVTATAINLNGGAIKNSLMVSPLAAALTFTSQTFTGVNVYSGTAPVVSFQSATDETFNESDGGVGVTVSITSAVSYDIFVDYQILQGASASSSDHTLPSTGTLTIPAGALQASLNFSINNDFEIEGTEAFTLALIGTSHGQLATFNTKNIFIVDDDLPNETVIQMAAGIDHYCMVMNTGSLYCWGVNSFGQIGDGTSDDRKKPVQIFANGVTSVSLGASFTCAVVNATVKCWGRNSYGQLGIGTQDSIAHPHPTTIAGLTDVIQIATGHDHACAVFNSSTHVIACWGGNTSGALGINSTTSSFYSPMQLSLSDVKKVSLGISHSCALVGSTPDLYCWGDNTYGQIGIGDLSNRLIPTSIPNNSSDTLLDIQLGRGKSCALTLGGSVHCWGGNAFNGLTPSGNQMTMPTLSGASLTSGAVRFFSNSPSRTFTYVVKTDSKVSYWGQGVTVAVANINSPAPAVGAAIEQEFYFTNAPASSILTNAVQAGANPANMIVTPVPVALSGIKKTLSSDGGQCYLTNAGALYCRSGYPGDGTANALNNAPIRVLDLQITDFAVSRWPDAGYRSICAIRSDKTLWCWGDAGLVGDGFNLAQNYPVYVMSHVTSVKKGAGHTCALKDSGQLFCWGMNYSGQLGLGSANGTTTVLLPKEVFSSSDVSAFALGKSHTCAIINGQLKCWGDANSGQIGDLFSMGTNQFAPVDVFSASPLPNPAYLKIVIGDDHSCTTLTTGTIRCWGFNNFGQLGRGDVTKQPIPINDLAIPFAEMYAGLTQTCSTDSAADLRCWGSPNGVNAGYLTTPPTTALLPNVTAVNLGATSTVISNGQLYLWGTRSLFYYSAPTYLGPAIGFR